MRARPKSAMRRSSSPPRLQPYVPGAATLYEAEAATVRAGGCNRTCRRLQKYVPEAATVRAGGCTRTCRGLQPYVLEAAAMELRLQLSMLLRLPPSTKLRLCGGGC